MIDSALLLGTQNILINYLYQLQFFVIHYPTCMYCTLKSVQPLDDFLTIMVSKRALQYRDDLTLHAHAHLIAASFF